MKIELGEINSEVKEITRKSLIAEIDLTNSTLTRLGGYNAEAYSGELELAEPFRTQSIKGVWRWWVRAILSGAAWEMGVKDTKKVVEITEKIMGSNKCASRLILKPTLTTSHTEAVLPEEAIRILAKSDKYLKIDENTLRKCGSKINSSKVKELNRNSFISDTLPPRLGLLIRDKNIKEKELNEKLQVYKPGSLGVHIQLRSRDKLGVDELRVAFGALLLALILQGVGSMTKRGFGHFQTKLKCFEDAVKIYEECVRQINQATDEETEEEALRDLIQTATDSAKRLINGGSSSKGLTNELPSTPSLTPIRRVLEPGASTVLGQNNTSIEQAFRLSVVKVNVLDKSWQEPESWKLLRCLGLDNYEDEVQLKLLIKLGRATMKSELRKMCKNASSGEPHTWVLGLPRSYFVKKTGYFLMDNKGQRYDGRRPSSISVAPLRKLNDHDWLVAVYGYLSSDWPRQISWVGGRGRREVINTNREIKQSFNKTFDLIEEYLKG